MGILKTVEQWIIIQQYGDWYRPLAVDGWTVTIGTASTGTQVPPRCTKCNVTAHPSAATVVY